MIFKGVGYFSFFIFFTWSSVYAGQGYKATAGEPSQYLMLFRVLIEASSSLKTEREIFSEATVKLNALRQKVRPTFGPPPVPEKSNEATEKSNPQLQKIYSKAQAEFVNYSTTEFLAVIWPYLFDRFESVHSDYVGEMIDLVSNFSKEIYTCGRDSLMLILELDRENVEGSISEEELKGEEKRFADIAKKHDDLQNLREQIDLRLSETLGRWMAQMDMEGVEFRFVADSENEMADTELAVLPNIFNESQEFKFSPFPLSSFAHAFGIARIPSDLHGYNLIYRFNRNGTSESLSEDETRNLAETVSDNINSLMGKIIDICRHRNQLVADIVKEKQMQQPFKSSSNVPDEIVSPKVDSNILLFKLGELTLGQVFNGLQPVDPRDAKILQDYDELISKLSRFIDFLVQEYKQDADHFKKGPKAQVLERFDQIFSILEPAMRNAAQDLSLVNGRLMETHQITEVQMASEISKGDQNWLFGAKQKGLAHAAFVVAESQHKMSEEDSHFRAIEAEQPLDLKLRLLFPPAPSQ
jgi:hypothetical protein